MSKIAGAKCSACLLVAAGVVGFACNALGQQNATNLCAKAATSNATLPEFEVATVKPFNPTGGIAGLFVYPGGRVGIAHFNLRMLLMSACNLQMFQVIGGPGWADTDYFNIEAKPPDSSPSAQSNPPNPGFPPNDNQRQMLLALLIDRFHLKFHVESREGPVYFLERGKGDPKFQPPKDKDAYSWAGSVIGGAPGADGIRGTNISMPQLAARISGWLGHPVLDRTGLLGSYDFEYRTGDDYHDPNADVYSSILTSLKGVGLKLTPARSPVETIVIDHVEQPSPN